MKLHAVWDHGLIDLDDRDEGDYADGLIAELVRKGKTNDSGTVEDWVNDMGLQLDFADRDLPFQLAIPAFKPPLRLARNKKGNSGDQREKCAAPDIEPIKLK
jgi:hypothetical protein